MLMMLMGLSTDGKFSARGVKPRWRSREEAFMTDSRRLTSGRVIIRVVGWSPTWGRKLEGSIQ